MKTPATWWMAVGGGLLVLLAAAATALTLERDRPTPADLLPPPVPFAPLPDLTTLPPSPPASAPPTPSLDPFSSVSVPTPAGAATPTLAPINAGAGEAERAPAPVGTLVFGLWGARYYYPATVVSRDGEGYQVLFEDGDRATLGREEFLVGGLIPGSHVEFSQRGSGFGRGVIIDAPRTAVYRVRQDGRDLWVQLPRIRIPADAEFRTRPLPADAEALPQVTIARYHGRSDWYTCSGVLDARSGKADRVDVLYDDGTQEPLDRRHIRTGSLLAGQTVTLRSGSLWQEGTIMATAGRAVSLRLDSGVGWHPLGALRFNRNEPPF